MGKFYEESSANLRVLLVKKILILLLIITIVGGFFFITFKLPLNTFFTRKIYINKLISKVETKEDLYGINKEWKSLNNRQKKIYKNLELNFKIKELENLNKEEKIKKYKELIKDYPKQNTLKFYVFSYYLKKTFGEKKTYKNLDNKRLENLIKEEIDKIEVLEKKQDFFNSEDILEIRNYKNFLKGEKRKKTKYEEFSRLEFDDLISLNKYYNEIKGFYNLKENLELLLDLTRKNSNISLSLKEKEKINLSLSYLNIKDLNNILKLEKKLNKYSKQKSLYLEDFTTVELLKKELVFLKAELKTVEKRDLENLDRIYKKLKAKTRNILKLEILEEELNSGRLKLKEEKEIKVLIFYYEYLSKQDLNSLVFLLENLKLKKDSKFLERNFDKSLKELKKELNLKLNKLLENKTKNFTEIEEIFFYLNLENKDLLKENKIIKKIEKKYLATNKNLNTEYLELLNKENTNLSSKIILLNSFLEKYNFLKDLYQREINFKLRRITLIRNDLKHYFEIANKVKIYNSKLSRTFNSINELKKSLSKIEELCENYNFNSENPHREFIEGKIKKIKARIKDLKEEGVNLEIRIKGRQNISNLLKQEVKLEIYLVDRFIAVRKMILENEDENIENIDLNAFKIQDNIKLKIYPKYDLVVEAKLDIINLGKYFYTYNLNKQIEKKYMFALELINVNDLKIKW